MITQLKGTISALSEKTLKHDETQKTLVIHKSEKDLKDVIVYERLEKAEKAIFGFPEDMAREINNQFNLVTEQVNDKYCQLYQHE